MIDEVELRPGSEAEAMLQRRGFTAHVNHYEINAIYVVAPGVEINAAVLGVDIDETQAILEIELAGLEDYFPGQQGTILHAYRDQGKKPGCWYWTQEQMRQAILHPDWVDRDEEGVTASPRAHRKNEIIHLGHEMGKSELEIQAQLQAEGFNSMWNEGFAAGKRWISFTDPEEEGLLPYQTTSLPDPTEQLRASLPLKFAGKRIQSRKRSQKPGKKSGR